jgi:SOS-response transcriptional repressor LexA
MVVKILQRHASRFTQELADLAASVLQVQIERLESIQEILWKKAATGDLKALELSIRVSESLRKLAGLDAPQRVQVEGVELKEFQILDVPFQLETPVLSELAAGTPPKQLELKD